MPEERSLKNSIVIRGARVNNLKNISLNIPRNKLVVITGLSGSGKSSLAFDTIYAEGQRRYVESLSSYARQFLGRINKPDVDFIEGIPPAIAIEQKVNTRNPRSTVGTSTEVYDYLKLLFARAGVTYSPLSGEVVKRDSVTDVVDYILSFAEGTSVLILSPVAHKLDKNFHEYLELLLSQGTTRMEFNGNIVKLEDVLKDKSIQDANAEINIIIDRIRVSHDEASVSRFADSVQTAYAEGIGSCIIKTLDQEPQLVKAFSNRFERDGLEFEEPNEHMFSFNSPYGACPKCEGYGRVIGIDEDLVIPDKSLSVYSDAVACWRGEGMRVWKEAFVMKAPRYDFPIHKPVYDLTEAQYKFLWEGNKAVEGLNAFFRFVEEQKFKVQYRVMLSRYSGKTTCPECKGARLRKDANYVKINGKTLPELVLLPIDELFVFFKNLVLSDHQKEIAGRILVEIENRLDYLKSVGLGYLTLNRLSSTLSGGESQRINLATSLGSSLVGSLYILDEPSIGLHPRDTSLLIGVLKKLQGLGNTVLVVEHDEEIMRAAHQIIDIGPMAGLHGGEVVFQGAETDLEKATSMTADYLTGKSKIPVPRIRRKSSHFLEVTGARENNLKKITVKFPLHSLCVVTGVSGSGKSTLVRDILYASLNKQLNGVGDRTGSFDILRGDTHTVKAVEFVDQNPIGKSSRSNPVTYSKAYDEIRKLFSEQSTAKNNNLKPSHFSFNIDGGRCEECQGEGEITVEMQFMADVKLVCESCHGQRFKEEVLEVQYRGKNIFDVLNMTVDEAIEFFGAKSATTERKIVEKLQPLADVGLGYVKLGQSSSTLSGGESQRVKLASFLSKESAASHTLFIFDEPTTGLHFHDISKLLDALNALIDNGHSVILIEHNLDVIKCADWIIDLGPEGGKNGGNLVFEGTPEGIVRCEESYTGRYLKEKI